MSRLLIQFSHLFKSFGPTLLFDDISLSINEGAILALVGENGAGKTTLLQLLGGLKQPDIDCFNRATHLTIGFLAQEIHLTHANISGRAYIEEGILSCLEQQMAICLASPDRLAEWSELHAEYEKLGGYRRPPLEKVLKGLKLQADMLDKSMASLSSGQMVRIALAKVLLQDSDLLLLDEPTNHLDQEMQAWLQEMLRLRKGATVIVSHDRKFLNATCNHLIEIKNGKLTCYEGNYDFYLTEQQRLQERQMQAYMTQEEERAQLKQKISAQTFAKGKPPPPSDRNIMAYDHRGEAHHKSLKRNLDVWKARLKEIEKNPIPHPKPKSITGLRFISMPLASSIAIELAEISKSFGNKILFSSLQKTLCKGDRIVLQGPNGSGKTTLLRCMAKICSIDSGSIRVAPTAKIAYLDQKIELLPMAQTPLKYFEECFGLSEEDLRRELHKAALGNADLLNRSFATLSVGQRKRLMLLSLILAKPNILLLDEPTNHLDFLTLEALEKALLDFEGAILAVSHDATFIEKIATDVWSL